MYQIPTFDEIRAAILRDTVSLQPQADISADSDHFVHASRLASCAVGQYAHQTWLLRQVFPNSADTEYLERHASLRSLRRKNPTRASGTLTAGGVAGAVIPAGVQIKVGNRFFISTGTIKLGNDGQAVVKITAVAAGADDNMASIPAQFMAAPTGVSSDALVIRTTGGTDAETDAALLARLLNIIRRPPAGGNRYDYRNWALSVDGVTSAYVYPLRRGLGTVDVVITSGNSVPSDATVASCQKYIDEMRPVTSKNSFVVKPHVTAINVTAQVKLDGIELAVAKERIQAALSEYFDSLIPGDGIIVSQIEAVISDVAGINDRRLTSPTTNRDADTANKIEWFKLGAVNITAMV